MMDLDQLSKVVASGFVKGEDGKLKIVPFKLPDFMKSQLTDKNDQKKTSTRKHIPLEKLVFPIPDWSHSPKQASKKRKLEKPVRKELFKIPAPKPKLDRKSSFASRLSNCRTLNARKSSQILNSKRFTEKQPFHTPLIDLDEAERKLKDKSSFSMKTVLFSTMAKSPAPTSLNVIKETEQLKTPRSADSVKSELEFLELENKAEIEATTAMPSVLPLSQLLEKTVGDNSDSAILEEIKTLFKKDQEQLIQLKEQQIQFEQQMQLYEQQHQAMQSRVIALFSRASSSDDNKENKLRKSSRKSAQDSEKKNKFVVSSANKSMNLRKTVLSNKLVKHLGTECESPRTRKAVNMYNTIRNDCSVLCTPKLDRMNIIDDHNSIRRSLSRRVQNQCLLLQETPKH